MKDCAWGMRMESDLNMDDSSSHENELQAETWFLNITLCLEDDRDFSDVLNTCKQQLECSLSTVSVISWAAYQDSCAENSGSQQYEGFLHYGSYNQIPTVPLFVSHFLQKKILH